MKNQGGTFKWQPLFIKIHPHDTRTRKNGCLRHNSMKFKLISLREIAI